MERATRADLETFLGHTPPLDNTTLFGVPKELAVGDLLLVFKLAGISQRKARVPPDV